jgi:dTDP-3-amino-2,3,6-trideoxy-4-keto-D-glucose/dTDP-3-amino-3,4,6-trideoxy-alpha-D-glucose/dTDP-2,6-dideoxy-D-kanosamine transaminase
MTPDVPLFSAAAANAGLDLVGPARRVLESHWYVMGQEVAAFEREFADYVGVARCVSLANGTDALELGLRALGVEAGDVVLCTGNAGFYSSTAIHLIGALPQYVDIDPALQTMDPVALSRALEAATTAPRAIIATHLYGQLAQIESICEIAARHGVPVLEDCAQSHGARRGGKLCGAFGALAAFSFYPTKNLGALGDGGAVVTDDPPIADRVARLRQYGWSSKYHVETPRGRNSRLDELQAALLREKLPRLDAWNAERRRIAARYNAAFADTGAVLPASLGEDYVAHLYVLRVGDRDGFREHMRAQGIATDVHYPIPDHRQPAYPGFDAALPATEAACAAVVSLPCYPGIPDAHVEQTIAAVQGWFAISRATFC